MKGIQLTTSLVFRVIIIVIAIIILLMLWNDVAAGVTKAGSNTFYWLTDQILRFF